MACGSLLAKGSPISIQFDPCGYGSQYPTGTTNANQKSAAAEYGKFEISASVTVETASVEKTGEPTLEDVKKEFYEYLDSLPVSAGLGGTPINVTVTEEAFERMRTDPEYMQRMKDLCKRDLCDPAWNDRSMMGPPTYMHINITDNTNNEHNSEYVATSYNYDTGSNYESETANSFWSRRTKKREEAEKIAEKRQEEREALERFLDRMREWKELFASSSAAGQSALPITGSYETGPFSMETGSVFAEV